MMILIVFRDAGHSMYQIHKPEEDPYQPSRKQRVCWDDTQDNLNAETCWFRSGGCVDIPRISGVLGYKRRTQTPYFFALLIRYRYSLHVCTLDI